MMEESDRTKQASAFFGEMQSVICSALENTDGAATFREDTWQHELGGGGRTRVLQGGAVFEKAGVNISSIRTPLSPAIASRMSVEPQEISASGISLVIHPLNPYVPAVHANFRYLELSNGDGWFGGGADLTPSYLYEEDARHFHSIWKRACDGYDPDSYRRFKKWCDEYFLIRHRGETRGIGGIFFDNLQREFDRTFNFIQVCAGSILDAYLPIVQRRRGTPYGERERQWQLLRRGRYAEFNLVYDKGTVFGLETGGRIESILMSLPPLAKWGYDVQPEAGSSEEKLVEALRKAREWL